LPRRCPDNCLVSTTRPVAGRPWRRSHRLVSGACDGGRRDTTARRTRDTHLERSARGPLADLGRHGGRLAGADGAAVPASAPDSLSRWARIGRVVNLLIRSLVQAVRSGSFDAVAEVDGPRRFTVSRSNPTWWVHDGYTVVRVLTLCLQSTPRRPWRCVRDAWRAGRKGSGERGRSGRSAPESPSLDPAWLPEGWCASSAVRGVSARRPALPGVPAMDARSGRRSEPAGGHLILWAACPTHPVAGRWGTVWQ
jgi:hypothetical protein